MKAISKKMMVLSLAGLMFGAAAGLAGCTNQHDVSNTEDRDYLISNKNVYIVVSENGVDTLHKGDVVTYVWYSGGYGGVASLPTVLKFNCGKELQTSQFVAYPKGCPKEDKYDEICDCAREITLQSQENGKNEGTKNSIAFATGRTL